MSREELHSVKSWQHSILLKNFVFFNDGKHWLFSLKCTTFCFAIVPYLAVLKGKFKHLSGASQNPNSDAVQNHAFAALQHGW